MAKKPAKKPDVEHIDILQMELDQKLPYWLDPSQKNPEKMAAIRDKHRAKWLADQKAKKPSK
jgi:hypothetical protein